ncbi:MAG: peptidoglycan DD-metalloendopeptidase family protein [Bacteroidota bacterium]
MKESLSIVLWQLYPKGTHVLKDVSSNDFMPLDLSTNNPGLEGLDITQADVCERYINRLLEASGKKVAVGGYLEKRSLYGSSERFQNEAIRNIHLGVDFWTEAGTPVVAPIAGKIHSFANNSDFGNYGPTVILEHLEAGITFYTLYGHLSLESFTLWSEGKEIEAGTVIGTLGTAEINVGYAPHLHFQIIEDLNGFRGDYPGVCSEKDFKYYAKNCINPNFLVRLPC